ncbi:hydantoinase/oxoprolinase family protein [Porticoccus sp. W117]|uniref:hydantoinase/oxoprolinase family protein n=1 Tax=Porticoccus sp. W117 TaxID=3054777 RepID=UPI0025994B1A|nr:hydantoinase/oxoprolinase family protein [Porticoccus sp. W117]MDM3871401.1 hydantoinase/oxoprolinase family protein [Porticoccus sp. W117]
MKTYSIGIDTGGTYTDAVIMDAQSRRLVASAKALTTKGDLALGVGEALEKVLVSAGETIDRSAINLVSLSTTLATNALVEGHGSAVGVFLIGFDDGMAARTQIAKAVPSAKVFRIRGGHKYTGQEQAALDTKAIETVLANEGANLDAFAVASHYSVRNPNHERRTEELIHQITGCPVTASCDLSAALDGPKRALTATFNARIISLIVALEQAVRSSMAKQGIDAQLMIVKGDGSIATAESVIAKPIETILSGPAASVIGARFLANKADFVLSDIGGTTSDIATVINGWPKLNEQGSEVGGFRTLVRAIDMQTFGLGGDSKAEVDFEGVVSLGNNRVVPMSLLAHRWPHIVDELAAALTKNKGMRGATHYLLFPEGTEPGVFPNDLSAAEKDFLARLKPDKPTLYNDAIYGAADRSRVTRLVNRGIIQESGCTPSDAAHILGLQSQWSAKGAQLAFELLGRANGLISADVEADVNRLAQKVHAAVAGKSTRLVVETLAGKKFADNDPLLSSVANNTHRVSNLRVSLVPNIDVIAVGGPAGVFYPAVGERLGCEVIIPQDAEVANAIGAATGSIKVQSVVEITRSDAGGYLIHTHEEPVACSSGPKAIDMARQLAHDRAQAESELMGGHSGEIEISVDRIDVPGLDESISLVAATVTAEVVSKVKEG